MVAVFPAMMSMRTARLARALASLGVDASEGVEPTALAIADALVRKSTCALAVYRAASCLREGELREVLQCLILGGLDAVRAAVRVMVVMKGAGGLWSIAMEFWAGLGEWQCIGEREWALFAYVGGDRARAIGDWSTILNRALQDGAHDDAKRALAMALAQTPAGVDSGSTDCVSPIQAWDAEVAHQSEPSFWREVAWGSFAKECGMNVDLQFDVRSPSPDSLPQPSTPALISSIRPWLEDVSAGNEALKAAYIRVCGVPLRKRGRPRTAMQPEQVSALHTATEMSCTAPDLNFVVTAGVRETIYEVAVALSEGAPMIIEGPPGCGKSALLAMLARATAADGTCVDNDSPGLTSIQMDSAMSSSDGDAFSALIGGIVPLPEGGGFRWRPGPIGTAVQDGDWLVLENMGSKGFTSTASSVPVISRLASVRPGEVFDAPCRGEALCVAPGFMCIATRTTGRIEATDTSWEPPGGWQHWRRIRMMGLSQKEQQGVLSGRFPAVADCASRVLQAISDVSAYVSRKSGPLVREPSMREAVRICQRLEHSRREHGELFTAESALLETMDVLISWAADEAQRRDMISLCAAAWSVPSDVGANLDHVHRPSLRGDGSCLRIGRASVSRPLASTKEGMFTRLALTGHTLRILERVLRCVQMDEPVLLTGETGCGKTSVVQELACQLGKKLIVVNMSRHSEIGDLVGGFRPVELSSAIPALARRFDMAFCERMSRKKNAPFLDALQRAARAPQHHFRAVRLMRGALKALPASVRHADSSAAQRWSSIAEALSRMERAVPCTLVTLDAGQSKEVIETALDKQGSTDAPPRKKLKSRHGSPCYESEDHEQELTTDTSDETGIKRTRRVEFEFAEGVLVEAMRAGDWILFDEINLAPPELLERLVSLADRRQILLPNEKGEIVSCGNGFTMFGAMNPPTDVGKRPLPSALRLRFSEFFVGDAEEKNDIALLALHRLHAISDVSSVSRGLSAQERAVSDDVASFYLACRDLAIKAQLEDGSGKRARFSLRNLCRMLDYASSIRSYMRCGGEGERRALYEGALMAFATPLPRGSRRPVRTLAQQYLLRRNASATSPRRGASKNRVSDVDLSSVLRLPDNFPHQIVAGFPLSTLAGTQSLPEHGGKEGSLNLHDNQFILTPAVHKTMQDVCRALVVGAPRLPILLQGPTAAGKTSLVAHLARVTGKSLVRINNHEHTDLAEYLGAYVATADGSLVFREGPVVQAARAGNWVVLDELNLAPPEVLESLNRLLDDNREIRIPETGEVVRAADGFTIFATQNPPGLYGGRKELSRAFRSRFVEVQVDELPDEDLLSILERRSRLPASFARKMIAVMRDLQMRRRATRLFSGKAGFVTARDLFRWAARSPRSKEELAIHGFFLLGERSRYPAEREVVRQVLVKHMGIDRDVLSDSILYSLVGEGTESAFDNDNTVEAGLAQLSLSRVRITHALREAGIAATPHMRRMITLLAHCVANNEPALLVGTTGGGKTSACSAIARALSTPLPTVNCHRHTESSDFIGGFRPVRNAGTNGGPLFEWADGPLLTSMKSGTGFLVDEINMADDAVIERLNSVLEPERSLLLSEKGAVEKSSRSADGVVELESELVVAHNMFRIFATMNPGGDFGKKELSPALRNRFTEIWIPSAACVEDYTPVVESRMNFSGDQISDAPLRVGADAISSFVGWALEKFAILRPGCCPDDVIQDVQADAPRYALENSQFTLSLRDVAVWSDFVRGASVEVGMHPLLAFAHGARLVFLDGLCVGSTSSSDLALEQRLWDRVKSQVPPSLQVEAAEATFSNGPATRNPEEAMKAINNDPPGSMRFGPFVIRSWDKDIGLAHHRSVEAFTFTAPCTARNCARVARAMSIDCRPVLLEGSPGAGKSSLVAALAAVAKVPLTRINLSEHTEISDLVGGDVPGTVAGTFCFRAGPLLNALRQGSWVLLDELNLASQSVLEGLNSVLDHRRSVFIPELAKEVIAESSFRVFGAQNPAHEGGGRRGLPRSFLNRFTRVFVEPPSDTDIAAICTATHPEIGESIIHNVVATLRGVRRILCGPGREYEDGSFGLRDALRWCDLMGGTGDGDLDILDNELGGTPLRHPGVFFDVVVLQGLRSDSDRSAAAQAYELAFGGPWQEVHGSPSVRSIDDKHVRVGWSVLRKGDYLQASSMGELCPVILPSRSRELQALGMAVAAGWPCIVAANTGYASADEASGLVSCLAGLCGRKITRIHAGSLSDSDDLLGGYVQRDITSELRGLASEAGKVHDLTVTILLRSQHTLTEKVRVSGAQNEELLRVLRGIVQTLADGESVSKSISSKILSVIQTLLQGLLGLFAGHERQNPVSDALRGLREREIRVRDLLSAAASGSFAAFEWQKSELVRCIERGDWILIEDASRCPPAVLDRLNPLLERPPIAVANRPSSRARQPDSVLLAEAPPHPDGSPVMMQPHSGFRLFFSFSDSAAGHSYRGLSRALRDRSLRIVVSSHLSLLDTVAVAVAGGLSTRLAQKVVELGQQQLTRVSGPLGGQRFAIEILDVLRSRVASGREPVLSLFQQETSSADNDSHAIDRSIEDSRDAFVEAIGARLCTSMSDFSLNASKAALKRDAACLDLVEGLVTEVLFVTELSSSPHALPILSLSQKQQMFMSSPAGTERCPSADVKSDCWMRLLRCALEVFVMGSQSVSDLLVRVDHLNQKVRSASDESVRALLRQVCCVCYDFAKLVQMGKLDHSSLVMSESVACPMDPVFSLDMTAARVIEQHVSCTGLSALRERAIRFRFEVRVLWQLRQAWTSVLADAEKSGYHDNNASLMTRSKLMSEMGPTGRPAANICMQQIERVLFDCLSSVIRFADAFCQHLSAVGDWELQEEDLWMQLFSASRNLCTFARAVVKDPLDMAVVIVMLREMRTIVNGIRDAPSTRTVPGGLEICGVLGRLTSGIYEDNLLNAALPLPRTKSGYEMESMLVSALRRRHSVPLTSEEKSQVAKALVSVSTLTVERDGQVLEALSKILNVFEVPPSVSSDLWGKETTIAHWNVISNKSVVNACVQVAVEMSRIATTHEFSVQLDFPNIDGKGLPLTSRSLLEAKLVPSMKLEVMIPLQRADWLMSSWESSKGELSRAELLSFGTEMNISVLSEMTERLFSQVTSSGAELLLAFSDRSVFTTSALRLVSESSLSEHFWESVGASSDAAAAACVMVGGMVHEVKNNVDSEYQLLAMSCYTACCETGFFQSKAQPELRWSDRTSVDHALQFLRVADFHPSRDEDDRILQIQRKAVNDVRYAIRIRYDSDSSQSVRHVVFASLAAAWISVSFLRAECAHRCIAGYQGLDPSLVAEAEAQLHADCALDECASSAAFQIASEMRIGGDTPDCSAPLTRSQAATNLHEERFKYARDRMIFRPTGRPGFSALENAVARVQSSIAEEGVVRRIQCVLADERIGSDKFELAVEEALALHSSCHAASTSLGITGELGHLRDVGGDVALCLRELQYGVLLCLKAAKMRAILSDNKLVKRMTLLADVALFPRAAYESAMRLTDILESYKAVATEDVILALTRYLAIQDKFLCQEMPNAISVAFDHIVSCWKAAKIDEEACTAKRNSLFVLRESTAAATVPGSNFLQTLEDDDEQDFVDTFNPMGEDFDDMVLDRVNGEVANEAGDPNSSTSIATLVSGDKSKVQDATQVWTLHRRCFTADSDIDELSFTDSGGWDETSSCLLELVGKLTSDTLLFDADWGNALGTIAASTILSTSRGAVMQASEETSRNTGKDPVVSRSMYNFYKDVNVEEVVLASRTLQRLIVGVEHVQSKYFHDTGGHPVLAGVASAAKRTALSGSSSTPLGTLVVSVENVLRKADEWQRHFATSPMRLQEEVRALAKLAARWRRLEVKSWPALLESRVVAAEANAHKWFYLLYDVVLREAVSSFVASKDANRATVSTMDQFLRSSPCGEFATRIEMLLSLGGHLLHDSVTRGPWCKLLGSQLIGLGRYYTQYLPQVEMTIKDNRAPIEKKMTEFASLATWNDKEELGASATMTKTHDKDFEYYRLKAASEKTRRKLHKLCRDMDAVMRLPVYEQIVRAMSRSGFDSLTTEEREVKEALTRPLKNQALVLKGNVLQMKIGVSKHLQVIRGVEIIEVKPITTSYKGRLENLGPFAERLADFGKSTQKGTCGSVQAAIRICSSLRALIRSRSVQLRLSEDTSIQPKKKALVDLLRGLETLGVSPYPTTVPDERREPGYWLGSLPPSQSVGLNKDADDLFFNAASRVLRLREVSDARSRNPDITPREAARAQAFCADLFDRSVMQRDTIRKALTTVEMTAKLASDLSAVVLPVRSTDVHPSSKLRALGAIALTVRRLQSIQRDMQLCASHSTSSVRSGRAVVAQSESTSPADKLRNHHLKHTLPTSEAVTSILSKASTAIGAVLCTTCSSTLVECMENGSSVLTSNAEEAGNEVLRLLIALNVTVSDLFRNAMQISENNVAVTMLRPIASFLRDATEKAQASIAPSRTSPEVVGKVMSTSAFATAIHSKGDDVVTNVMLASQSILRRQGSRLLSEVSTVEDRARTSEPSESVSVEDDNLLQPKALTLAHTEILKTLQDSRLERILVVLQGLVVDIGLYFGSTCEDAGLASRTSEYLHGLLKNLGSFVNEFLRSLIVPLTGDAVLFHLMSLKLLRTLASVFTGIAQEGFCRPADAPADGEENETLETTGGAGFGDAGDGDASLAQDVSEEIEDEEQLLGLKDKEPDNKQDPKNSQQEQDLSSGLEMTNDFDGELEDMPDIEKNENESDDVEAEAEKQMADKTDKEAEVIDERLWNNDLDGPANDDASDANPDVGEDVDTGGRGPEADLVAKGEEKESGKKDDAQDTRSRGTHADIEPGDGSSDAEADLDAKDGQDNAGDANENQPDVGQGENQDLDKNDSRNPKMKVGDESEEEGSGGDCDGGEAINQSLGGGENEHSEMTDEQDGDKATTEPEDGAAKNDEEGEGVDADMDYPMTGVSGDAEVSDGPENVVEGDEDRMNRDGDGEATAEFDEDMVLNEDGRENDDVGDSDSDHAMLDEIPDEKGEQETDLTGAVDNVDADSDGVPDEDVAAAAADDNPAATEELKSRQHMQGGTATTHEEGARDPSAQDAAAFNVSDPSSVLRKAPNESATFDEQNTSQPGADGGLQDGDARQSNGQDSNTDIENVASSAAQPDPDVDHYEQQKQDDPNPHRALSSAELVKQWERQLSVLEESKASADKPSCENDNEGIPPRGLQEFVMNDGGDDKSGAENNHALGAATEEQHRPLKLNEREESENEGEAKENAWRNEREASPITRSASDRTAAPSADTPRWEHGNDGVSDAKDACQEGAGEDEVVPDVEMQRHPVEVAVQSLEHDRDNKRSENQSQAGVDSTHIVHEEKEQNAAEELGRDEGNTIPLPSNPTWTGVDLSLGDASVLWRKLESLTATGAATLCEQLRLVLEPTVATGLAGGFRTGKRLDMRRVIEFVASDFRRDRIWLRRIRPDKRSYDVLVAIDDSESMSESGAGPLALEALALITTALSKLEVGRLAVTRFGAQCQTVRSFVDPLPMSEQHGGMMLQNFTFTQKHTDVKNLLSFIKTSMVDTNPENDEEQIKLAFVISDGRLSERDEIRRQIRHLADDNILVAFILVDSSATKDRTSIFDVKRVEYDAAGKVSVLPYMHEFPMEFYAVVQDVSALPSILADALRQWLEISANS